MTTDLETEHLNEQMVALPTTIISEEPESTTPKPVLIHLGPNITMAARPRFQAATMNTIYEEMSMLDEGNEIDEFPELFDISRSELECPVSEIALQLVSKSNERLKQSSRPANGYVIFRFILDKSENFTKTIKYKRSKNDTV